MAKKKKPVEETEREKHLREWRERFEANVEKARKEAEAAGKEFKEPEITSHQVSQKEFEKIFIKKEEEDV